MSHELAAQDATSAKSKVGRTLSGVAANLIADSVTISSISVDDRRKLLCGRRDRSRYHPGSPSIADDLDGGLGARHADEHRSQVLELGLVSCGVSYGL